MAPWGQAAENLRVLYLSYCMQAASDGYKKQARDKAADAAEQIWNLLNGPKPKRRPQKASDFVRE